MVQALGPGIFISIGSINPKYWMRQGWSAHCTSLPAFGVLNGGRLNLVLFNSSSWQASLITIDPNPTGSSRRRKQARTYHCVAPRRYATCTAAKSAKQNRSVPIDPRSLPAAALSAARTVLPLPIYRFEAVTRVNFTCT